MSAPQTTIAFAKSDEFGIFPGSGWVLLEQGKRIDWPMRPTHAEAAADLADFRRSYRQLASDEASEAHGLRLMGAL